MERRGFIGNLFGLGAVVVIAPAALTNSVPAVEPAVLYEVDTAMLPVAWDVEKVMEVWRAMGIMPIDSFRSSHVVWKGIRKVGKLEYYDNDGNKV